MIKRLAAFSAAVTTPTAIAPANANDKIIVGVSVGINAVPALLVGHERSSDELGAAHSKPSD